MTSASMTNGTAPKASGRIVREIPHTVSPGLWALAWKRLKSDNVGMVSLVIVAAFILMMIASATGLIARNWAKETGLNYAPPSFIGADIEGGAPAAPVTPPGSAAPAVEFKSEVVDPLADVLAEIRDSGTTIYAIGLGPKVDAEGLKRVAEASGGAAYFPEDVSQLPDHYRRVVDDLRRRYLVTYTSTNSTRNGAWRDVAIETARPGVVIRSGGGYNAPGKVRPTTQPQEQAAEKRSLK